MHTYEYLDKSYSTYFATFWMLCLDYFKTYIFYLFLFVMMYVIKVVNTSVLEWHFSLFFFIYKNVYGECYMYAC